MNEDRARQILGKAINPDDSIGPNLGHYMAWSPVEGLEQTITLDSEFSVEELEALAWWLRNKGK